jgi:putative glycosyltransferase (TIGR04348 family)
MQRIVIVTPAAAGARSGNRHTALRWGALLRGAGYRVRVAAAWQGEPCDTLVALHARRSHDSIVRFRQERPGERLVVVLTGTDLYRDLPDSADARQSLELADRVIVLQEAALREIDRTIRRKARVVYQSAAPGVRHSPADGRFRIAVIGHLRAEKDPMRTALALAHLRAEQAEVVHLGAALDPAIGQEAERLMAREPRYRWLGSVTHSRALAWLARSHLLVVSSVMEGGANVIAEAARVGTPVIASRVSGNVGMLGRDYPGYFPLYDEKRLARLLERAASDQRFYRALKQKLLKRRPLFAPAAERKALIAAIR